ncbi:coxsackievirus and adenovirus receptor-like [Archocentrus centrarchus]|uniref:coxsackievirus and adenovirus receptor-like n=1 Tax=Archocentrus centrarchus TaxID=63155 RepID=UPI0011EA116E|nr:coxsackievirus and adenovirus receptor-like [Archocentrus centrarchus]
MTAVPASLCCAVLLFSCVFAEQKTITAEPGQTVTLPCRAPNNNLIVVDWSRTDLDPEYMFLYRDGHFDADNQHPSFKNRVELQDRQMKDGDVSVILKDVTTADSGKYECRIKEKGTSRAVLGSEPISTITLRVGARTGQVGRSNDGEDEDDGSAGLTAGLSVCAGLLVVVAAVVGLLIYRYKKQSQASDMQPV